MNAHEINFDAGRPFSSYKRLTSDGPGFSPTELWRIPSSSLLNTSLLGVEIARYFRQSEMLFETAVQKWEMEKGSVVDLSFGSSAQTEFMIYAMRRAVDYCIQAKSLFLFEQTGEDIYLTIDAIGYVDKRKNEYTDLFDFGETKNDENFIQILNRIANIFKHHYHNSQNHFAGIDFLSICRFEKKNGLRDQDVTLHNHHVGHLIMGFQDQMMKAKGRLNALAQQSKSG